MSTPLTSPAVAAFASERNAKALWLEWLTFWFNGTTRTVGTVSVDFPLLRQEDIHFDGGPARQPLAGLPGSATNPHELRIIHTPLRSRIMDTTAPADALDGRHVYDHVAITFWLSTRALSMPESNMRADQVTQCLHALLLHPLALQPLGCKGIHGIYPQRPTPVQAPEMAVRLIRVQAQYHYQLPFAG